MLTIAANTRAPRDCGSNLSVFLIRTNENIVATVAALAIKTAAIVEKKMLGSMKAA